MVECRWSSLLVRALGVTGLLIFTGCAKDDPKKAAERKGTPPTQVVVATVGKKQVPIEIRAIGNIEAFSAVDVKSQVAGPIAEVAFEEGKDVRKGQVLFQIDPRPFEQAVRQAEAELANRKAALAQAEANFERDTAQAKNAQSQADRYAALTAKGIIAREQNEQLQTSAVAAEKAVSASKASHPKRTGRNSRCGSATRRRPVAVELRDYPCANQWTCREPHEESGQPRNRKHRSAVWLSSIRSRLYTPHSLFPSNPCRSYAAIRRRGNLPCKPFRRMTPAIRPRESLIFSTIVSIQDREPSCSRHDLRTRTGVSGRESSST